MTAPSESPLLAALEQADLDALELTFARAYFRRLPAGYLSTATPEELAARARSLLGFTDRRGTADAAVRVFRPTLEEDGYVVAGTVLEVVTDDRPFLVDSVTAELGARDLTVELLLHPVVGTIRDETGRLTDIVPARSAEVRESVHHYELHRALEPDDGAELQAAVERILSDVRKAVRDFPAMQASIDRMIEVVEAGGVRYDQAEVEEAKAFLRWLLDDNFVLLGYREYTIDEEDGVRYLGVVPDSGLGILADTDRSHYATRVPFTELPEALQRRYDEGELLVITKTNRHATVHRRARMDYIGVRHVGPDGGVVGEVRLLGLFTSRAYMTRAGQIPMLRRRLATILEAEDLIPGSHDHKLLTQLFDTFPKDELFATPLPEIRQSLLGLLELEESHHIKVLVRPDPLHRSVSLLVALPREQFSATLRRRLQQLFLERFEGETIDYRLALGEAGGARIHFTVWVPGQIPSVRLDELEAEVVALARSWEDRLIEHMTGDIGAEAARDLVVTWAHRLPEYYRASTPVSVAAGDIARLHDLMESGRSLLVGLQPEPETGPEPMTRIAVYHLGRKMDLSTLLPTLESLGLRVIEEIPTRLLGEPLVFINDFGVFGPDDAPLDLASCGTRVAAAITAMLDGDAAVDDLNRIIVTSSLDHRDADLLRTYRTYWRRVAPVFTVGYVDHTLAAHPAIAEQLVRLFAARFEPNGSPADEDELRTSILAALEAVPSLDEDRILRSFLRMIDATVRTNAYRSGSSGLALKLRSADVPDMPAPCPRFEIFVTAPDVEGIHLRGDMVARGGIRHSDRREDYRTEVLGLMKAQITKNAVIVPAGAKGGFIVRDLPADRGAARDAVRAAYANFIRGLLDVTDNLVAGSIVPPPGVRVHDGDDPYLVVAADKGTATLSDTANEIAAEYGFWLGDAFASGGSAGYDHKALGITARGAWESVKRSFRELGLDPEQDPITVIGIGDMSGDVFGNGLLLSRSVRLVAAFDHRHILIDPDPDPELAYDERARLFALAGSSWDDYDRTRISDGGGVYPRSAKRVEISGPAAAALGTEPGAGTPDELIRRILTAPVDLFWNGGIGTFVKAAGESNLDAGDRTNDAIRVNGADLRCRVVGEGGNLGFTQRGRIEYARTGGRIHTDFIDNSGGVDCSDREVNLKILLGLAIEAGQLPEAERDAVVEAAAQGVVDRVIYDNYLQAQILGQEFVSADRRMADYEDLMVYLEADGLLDRRIEHLPATDEIADLIRDNRGLTRPELAVLLAYAKRSLKAELLRSDLPDSTVFDAELLAYFPKYVAERFAELIPKHPLRRELIATLAANQVVNSEGITFVTRLMTESGAEPSRVVRAYRSARTLARAAERWTHVEAAETDVGPDVYGELMRGVDDLVEGLTRWYLDPPATPLAAREAAADFEQLERALPDLVPPELREEARTAIGLLTGMQVPESIATRHAFQPALLHAPNIIGLARKHGREIPDVAAVFFSAGHAVQIDWLEWQANHLPATTRWHRWARQTLLDDLRLLRRELAERVLAAAGELQGNDAVDHWLAGRSHGVARLLRFTRSLAREAIEDPGPLVVAIRHVRRLIG